MTESTIVAHVGITEAPLDVEAMEGLVLDSGAGAFVTFAGRVRNHDHGRDVAALEYSAHPHAERVLAEICAAVAHGSPTGVRAVAAAHRVGPLAVGEVAFVVIVAAEHREAAFRTCSTLVEDVKANLPVWKHQKFTDGSAEWVNCA